VLVDTVSSDLVSCCVAIVSAVVPRRGNVLSSGGTVAVATEVSGLVAGHPTGASSQIYISFVKRFL
jgi:hypothetical protein